MEVGLTCELIPGDGFLARHLTRSLDGIPIAGRIVQQTMSNEHERFGPEALGIHYLGFIARTEGSEALPSVLQDAAWQVIKHARWVRDLAASHRSVTDLKSLRQLLSTDSTVKEVIAEALRSTAGLEWLSEHTRAAEHSEVGRRLLSWITEDVRRLQLPQVSLEHYIDAASHRLAALPETQRLRMALDGYYAVAASSVQAHRWLNSVLNEACKPTLLSYP
jgi:hypothetical protein